MAKDNTVKAVEVAASRWFYETLERIRLEDFDFESNDLNEWYMQRLNQLAKDVVDIVEKGECIRLS